MDQCAFDKLFTKNVPHLLEKIFFSLDYESFKNCRDVSNTWHGLLSSDSYQKKGQSVFHYEIRHDELELWTASQEGNVVKVRKLLSSGMLDVNCEGGVWEKHR